MSSRSNFFIWQKLFFVFASIVALVLFVIGVFAPSAIMINSSTVEQTSSVFDAARLSAVVWVVMFGVGTCCNVLVWFLVKLTGR